MKKEAVFVHVPKTGGASIIQICLRHGIRIVDHDLRNPAHVSLAKYKEVNNNIYSFAIVRNPWSRLVSTYHFLRDGGIKQEDKSDADRYVNSYKDFNEFVLEAFQDPEILEQIHFRPQYQWVSDENGLIVDLVGRFEKLQMSCIRWCKLIGLPEYKLPHVNKSEHKSYKTYYSEKTIDIIRKVYSTDVELFKYRF